MKDITLNVFWLSTSWVNFKLKFTLQNSFETAELPASVCMYMLSKFKVAFYNNRKFMLANYSCQYNSTHCQELG